MPLPAFLKGFQDTRAEVAMGKRPTKETGTLRPNLALGTYPLLSLYWKNFRKT